MEPGKKIAMYARLLDVLFVDDRDGWTNKFTHLCKNWCYKKQCFFGTMCSYAHGFHELRPRVVTKRFKTMDCCNANCPYGKYCGYVHGELEYTVSADMKVLHNPNENSDIFHVLKNCGNEILVFTFSSLMRGAHTARFTEICLTVVQYLPGVERIYSCDERRSKVSLTHLALPVPNTPQAEGFENSHHR
eukprot:UN27271